MGNLKIFRQENVSVFFSLAIFFDAASIFSLMLMKEFILELVVTTVLGAPASFDNFLGAFPILGIVFACIAVILAWVGYRVSRRGVLAKLGGLFTICFLVWAIVIVRSFFP